MITAQKVKKFIIFNEIENSLASLMIQGSFDILYSPVKPIPLRGSLHGDRGSVFSVSRR